MAEKMTRNRRTDEQRIADLEARIAELKTRAARKEAKTKPAARHTVAALKAIDKALGSTNDNATRAALSEARATLSACLALDGVVISASGGAAKSGARRSSRDVEAMMEALFTYVRQNPGQRGELIAEALDTDVKTMRLPMHRLIEDRRVKTKGQKRGTTYFAT